MNVQVCELCAYVYVCSYCVRGIQTLDTETFKLCNIVTHIDKTYIDNPDNQIVKQTNKQTRKQTHKQTHKQTNKNNKQQTLMCLYKL